MNASFDLITVIMILGAVQGIFLSFLLFTQKRVFTLPARFLAILILVISLLLFLASLYQSKNYSLLVIFGPLLLPLFLTAGPLLYLYTKSLSDKQFVFGKNKLFHFAPYAAGVIILSALYFKPFSEQVEFIDNFYFDKARPFELIFRYVDIILRAAYTIISVRILTKYKSELEDEFSSTEKFDYTWLKQLLIYCIISILFLFLITVFNLGNNIRLIVGIYFSLLMYVIGYKFIKLRDVYSPEIQQSEKKVKYQKSGLSKEDKHSIGRRLENLMEKEKLYLDSDITCGKLSSMLDVSQNHLSQVINEVFGKNFFEYINGYRIEEAKKMLISLDNNWTILAIAFEVGFQSKSTFNAVFKKVTKLTPTQFRDKHSG